MIVPDRIVARPWLWLRAASVYRDYCEPVLSPSSPSPQSSLSLKRSLPAAKSKPTDCAPLTSTTTPPPLPSHHHRPRQSGTTPLRHHHPGLPYACPLRCIIASPPLSPLPVSHLSPPRSRHSAQQRLHTAVRADRSCPAVAPHALAPSTPGHTSSQSIALHHAPRSFLPVTLHAAAIATAA